MTASLFAACSTPQQKVNSGSRETELDRRVAKNKARMEMEQDQKDKSRVIVAKRKMQGDLGGDLAPAPIFDDNFARHELKKEELRQATEGALYADVLDRYQSGNKKSFLMSSNMYLQRFPRADRKDDVLYMRGLNFLAEKSYGEALISLNQILREHPTGRKSPAALFAKGIVFKRMNLPEASRSSLIKIKQDYPGSPEAQRASVELKLIK